MDRLTVFCALVVIAVAAFAFWRWGGEEDSE
jgi:hypothetical protein